MKTTRVADGNIGTGVDLLIGVMLMIYSNILNYVKV